MDKHFIVFLKKSQSRVKICIGLCLALIFCIFCNDINTLANDGDYFLYPIKVSNILSTNSDNRLDVGFSTAEMARVSYRPGILENYYDYVNRLIHRAAQNVQSYYSKDVVIIDNTSYFIDFFKSYGYQYFENRDDFLNVYLTCNDVGDHIECNYIFQLNHGFDGLSDSSVVISNNSVARYALNSDCTFYGYYGNDSLWLLNNKSSFLFGPSNSNSNLSYSVSQLTSSFDYYFNYQYNQRNYFIEFYNVSGDTVYFYIDSFIRGTNILPLYLDSPVYFPLSFVSDIDNTEVHGDFSFINNNPLYFYTPDVIPNTTAFSGSVWNAGEFDSGIVYGNHVNPFLTPTPIPTFSPLISPTPVPTYFLNVTITPIILPLDPNISSSYGDPISYVMAMINMVGDVLSSNVVTFFSTVVQYIYNSSYFFQILMFVIPAIILIAFVVGRLKKK